LNKTTPRAEARKGKPEKGELKIVATGQAIARRMPRQRKKKPLRIRKKP